MIKMVRKTSLQAYKRFSDSGEKDTQEMVVLNAIVDIYPKTITRRELANGLKIEMNSLTARVNELLKKKDICEVGRRVCSISGKKAYLLRASTGINKFSLKRKGE